jgi:uncharacterized protein (TIGR02001 family)
MTLNKLVLGLALALFALPMSALAQDAAEDTDNPAQGTGEADQAPEVGSDEEVAESNLSWNLSVTSDYVFRGVTQSNFKPAVQGGLDYAFGDSGFYVGVWGSNIDFDDSEGPNIELDSYVGWSHDLSEAWNLDLSVVHYAYLGESEAYGSINYNEFIVKNTWNEMVTFTVGYAPDYSNADVESWYYNLGGTWEIGDAFSLNAGIGRTTFDDDTFSFDYNDWNIGVSRQFGPVNAAINYYDTNIDGPRVSDTVVLTLGFEG